MSFRAVLYSNESLEEVTDIKNALIELPGHETFEWNKMLCEVNERQTNQHFSAFPWGTYGLL